MADHKQDHPAKNRSDTPIEHHVGEDAKKRPTNKASVDEEVEESFPASDPPSYAGGTAGAPSRHKDGKEPRAKKH